MLKAELHRQISMLLTLGHRRDLSICISTYALAQTGVKTSGNVRVKGLKVKQKKMVPRRCAL